VLSQGGTAVIQPNEMTFNRIYDSSQAWNLQPSVQTETATVAELIDLILGTRQAGATLLSQIDYQSLSTKNLPSHLLSMLQAGTAPDRLGLTARQLTKLRATLELGKRLYCAPPVEGEVLDDPSKAAAAVQYTIGYESVEKFVVLVLDMKHRLLAQVLIGSGSIRETVASPRDIFRAVLLANGARCIVAHNHPSQSIEPSPEDLEITRSLLQVGRAIDVPLLDHLIVSHSRCLSLHQTTDLWQQIPQGI
jgi:DNA repair protein RadC